MTTSCPYAPTFCTGVPPTRPRNAYKTLQSSTIHSKSLLNAVLPGFAGAHAKQAAVPFYAFQPNMNHEPGKSAVSNEQIASAAKYE